MIRKRALRLALVLFSVLALGLVAVPVGALVPPPPPPPECHYFLGAVTFAGNPAPQGTIVSAHWDTSSKQTTVDADGNYGKTYPGFYIEENGINPGDEITFKVNGVEAATHAFNAPDTTTLNLNIETATSLLTGVTGEVNCDTLSGATVDLYKDDTLVGTTESDGDGNYSVPVMATGDYEVKINKSGFREETQSKNIPSLGPQYELDFIAETGLIPDAPDVFYVLECVNHWLYPEPPCGLTVFKVLEVVNAWLYPV